MKIKYKNITFTNEILIDKIYHPVPASKIIPNWYKEMESYRSGGRVPGKANGSNGTIKKCMPVFDAMTAGYILVTNSDIYIRQEDGAPYYQWSGGEGIHFHPLDQAPNHPFANGHPFPKWLNSWSIQTPKGYSTLYLQPMHRESIINVLPGIIDTDSYTPPGNIIFTLADKNFEGLIPAGTPVVQVIPFKRESWKMVLGSEKNSEEKEKQNNLLRSKFHDGYKNLFWTKKEYK